MNKLFIFFILFFLVSVSVHADYLTGLVGYWNMDEASGTNVANSVVGAVNGTATATEPVTITGHINNARNQSGADGKGITLDASICNVQTSDFTFSTWYKYGSATVTTDNAALIGNERATAPYEGWFIDIMGTAGGAGYAGKIRTFLVTAGGSMGEFGTSNQYNITDRWTHLVVVRTSTNITFWINGTQVPSVVLNARNNPALNVTNNVACMLMGNGNSNAYAFTGGQDESALWLRALNATEIAGIYNAGLGFPYPFQTDFYSIRGWQLYQGAAINNATISLKNPTTNAIYAITTTNSSGQYIFNGTTYPLITNQSVWVIDAYFRNETHWLTSSRWVRATVLD